MSPSVLLRPLGLLAAVALLAACADPAAPTTPAPTTAGTGTTADTDFTRVTSVQEVFQAEPGAAAAALIQPTRAGSAEGYVAFTETADGVRVRVRLRGLEPNARRGFHVHENGSCADGEDGTPAGAAGGHFNPLDDPHGGRVDPVGERHVGDFGNIESDADGHVDTTFEDRLIRLSGERSILGKAVIVHLDEDDLESQPTGDAGGRSGCGIVEAR